MSLIYLLSIIFLQQTSAQILTVAGNNFIPNLYNPNVGSNIPLTAGLGLSNGIALANIGQTGTVELANIPRNAATCNNANANLENFYIPNPSANQAFNGNNANIGLAKNGACNNYANIGQARKAAGNVANIGLNNGNVANIENVKAYVPSSTSANNPISKYANVVKPPRDYGIEFGADDLEVNGAVQVSGRMPFNAKVALQGSMPAQGKGTVSYTCDKVDES